MTSQYCLDFREHTRAWSITGKAWASHMAESERTVRNVLQIHETQRLKIITPIWPYSNASVYSLALTFQLFNCE